MVSKTFIPIPTDYFEETIEERKLRFVSLVIIEMVKWFFTIEISRV